MPKLADRVKETTATTGTGAYSLDGAAAGFQAFSTAFVTTDTVYYCVEDGTDWEVGIGTLASGTPWTMARTSILASSNAGAAVNWGVGTKNVFATVPASAPGLLSREVLTADRTYYVATTGSDSNDGLSSGAPFLTIQKAVDTVAALDISIYNVTIQIADGTYQEAVSLKIRTGSGICTIQGNAGTPSAVLVNPTSGSCFSNTNAGRWDIKDLKIASTTSMGFTLTGGNALIRFNNIDFGQCPGSHIFADMGASVIADGNYTISAGSSSGAHVQAEGGFITLHGRTVTLTGTPSFAAGFAWCGRGLGYFSLYSMTFSGGATGARYLLSGGNASCFTNGGGSTYLPGDSAGTASNGSVYI